MTKQTKAGKTEQRRVQIVLPDLKTWTRALYRRGVLGVLVLSLTLITFVGLFQESSGFLIDWWSNLLLRVFGWGSYVVTLCLGGCGVLILLAKVPKRTQVPWHIVTGAEIVFLALLSLTHLLFAGTDPWQTADSGGAGGYVGAVFSSILNEFLGPLFAGLTLTAVLIWGVIVISGLTFEEWAERAEDWFYQVRVRLGHLLMGSPEAAKEALADQLAVDLEPDLRPPASAAGAAIVPGEPKAPRRTRKYQITLPSLRLLHAPATSETNEADIQHKKRVIEVTLAQFGVPAEVVEINRGPMVTQFGVEPGYTPHQTADGEEKPRKVRVSTIASLNNDLALALSAAPIRIETPIPGRSLVGIEVPNTHVSVVPLRKVMASAQFEKRKSNLMLALGEGVAGTPVIADLGRMPHLLIAGATGSGKSVCINALATCLLFQNSPLTLRLVMIDPKRVEMTHYGALPHLYGKIESDVERIVGVLHWLVNEMQERYQKLAKAGARHIDDYNRHWQVGSSEYLPRIVTMIDELADLMAFAPEEAEKSICRLAQMARATGMHLVMATQRPSVDVVTGLIKANFPARIGFMVSSNTDSRVILDAVGAETLLGKGDMLYMSPEASHLVRAQGCFVSDVEIDRVVRHWQEWAAREEWEKEPSPWDRLILQENMLAGDDLLQRAIAIVRMQGNASASMLQRRMHIGYPRAARLIDELEELGIVGPAQSGGRPREVLHIPEFEMPASPDVGTSA
jgi:S-DNA-T family DNA segregation ATPase FtsK/SpoIIIE